MLEIFFAAISSGIFAISFAFLFLGFDLKNNKSNYYELGLFGLIFLSFFSLFLNFFFPINKLVGTTVLSISYIIFIYIFIKSKNQKDLIKCLLFTSLFSLILISYSNINRPDAGLYHLPFTSIINNEKILIGSYNINFRYAHTSIIQYLSAIHFNHIFSIEFINLPIITIVSFFVLYTISKILYFIKTKNINDGLFYILFFIFTIISFNNYTNFGNDASTHIYFFLLALIYFENRFKIETDKKIFFKLLLISIFLFAQKLFMIIIFSLILLIFIKFKSKLEIFKSKYLYLIIFLFFSLVLKNLLVSSCLLYPIKITCFKNFIIYNENIIEKEAITGEAWAKGWTDQKSDKIIKQEEYIKNFKWLNTWSSIHLKEIFEEIFPFFIFLTIIYFVYLFYSKRKNHDQNYSLIKNFSYLLYFGLFAVIIWFLKFPLYRYGESFIAFLIIVFFVYLIKNKSLNFSVFKKMTLSFLFIGVFFIFTKNFIRIYKNLNSDFVSYPWPKIYTLNDYEDNIIPTHISMYDDENNFIYYFSGGKECMYSKAPCSNFEIKNLKLKIKKNYKIYFPGKVN